MQRDYIPKSETEIRFITEEKPDEFEQVRNIGTIQEYSDVREKTFWERIGPGGSITARPIVHNGTIYFGAYDKNFYALDMNGKEIWRFSTGGVIQSYALAMDNVIIFGSSDNNLYALDAKTGRMLWKFQSEGPIGGSPVEYKGRIYFSSSDGKLYCLDKNGNKIWIFKTPYALITPLIVQDKIFVGYNGSSLYCLNLQGELLWRFNANGWIAAWPAAYENGIVYFGSEDKNLYAITADGNLKWKYASKETILSPVIWEGKIYFGCGDDKLYCVSSDGRKLWAFKAEGTVGHATVSGDSVYFGSYDNNMYAANKDNGELKWKFRTNNFVHTNPLIHRNLVIFGSWDCNLYCLNKEGRLIWKFPTSLSTPSKILPPEKTETKNIELIITHGAEKPKEKKYKSHEVFGDYEADVTVYASGMSKTYLSSRKRGYIDR